MVLTNQRQLLACGRQKGVGPAPRGVSRGSMLSLVAWHNGLRCGLHSACLDEAFELSGTLSQHQPPIFLFFLGSLTLSVAHLPKPHFPKQLRERRPGLFSPFTLRGSFSRPDPRMFSLIARARRRPAAGIAVLTRGIQNWVHPQPLLNKDPVITAGTLM